MRRNCAHARSEIGNEKRRAIQVYGTCNRLDLGILAAWVCPGADYVVEVMYRLQCEDPEFSKVLLGKVRRRWGRAIKWSWGFVVWAGDWGSERWITRVV